MTEPSFLTRTRTSYNEIAGDYAEAFDRELPHGPLERGMLAAFAEMVRADGLGDVIDAGCGPGHVTAYLNELGVRASGSDLSPGMVAQARRLHPDVRFDEGSMTALDQPDGSLGGIVAMFSIIYIPTGDLPAVFAEFHRVLAPGGRLLLVFQTGSGEQRQVREMLGHPVALESNRRSADEVINLLVEAGFTICANMSREPDGVETARGANLLARKV